MRHVEWTAQELLNRNGFWDGLFCNRAGRTLSPSTCVKLNQAELAGGSHLPEEEYPHYVLCLIEQLRNRGVRHIVLGEQQGGHNVDTIESFVYDDVLFSVDKWHFQTWLASLPSDLQCIFSECRVVVECLSIRNECAEGDASRSE